MKKQFLSLLPAVALLAVAVIGPAPAEATEIRADIPFSFTVGGRTMPPGAYTLSLDRATLTVQGATGGAVVLTIAAESREKVRPSLVFHRYGERYVLRQAWTGGGSGRELPEEKSERELVRSARNGRTARAFERVVIPAL